MRPWGLVVVAVSILIAGALVAGTLLYIDKREHRCDEWKAALAYTRESDVRTGVFFDLALKSGRTTGPRGQVVRRPEGC